MKAADFALRLAERAEAVVQYLLPKGRRVGKEWRVGSVNGEPGRSLGVVLEGNKRGYWHDFETNEHGDLLDLWGKTQNLTTPEAMRAVATWLGVDIKLKSVDKPKTVVNVKPKLTPLHSSSAVCDYLQEQRKLNLETLNAFRIGEHQGQIALPYYRNNELLQVKYLALIRKNGKKRMYTSPGGKACLFGWQALPRNTNRIAITEGELDAMSLHQYGIFALSLPYGGGNKQQWLDEESAHLSRFTEIDLCFDNDTVGQQTVEAVLPRLGAQRCRVIKLPHKDANACLQAGVSKEAIQKCFQQATLGEASLTKGGHYFTDIASDIDDEFNQRHQAMIGIKPPWSKAQDKIAFRRGELSLWTGINGHGKSQFLGQIALSSMEQGAKVYMASMELNHKRLLTRLCRQAGALYLPSKAYIEAMCEWYAGKLWLFDWVGCVDAATLFTEFQQAIEQHHVDTFIVDSLLKIDIDEDDYTQQRKFVEQLFKFAHDNNVHVHLIAHPRKAIDESHLPSKLDIRGAGAVTDCADNCFTVWRNKRKEEKLAALASQGLEGDENLNAQSDCLWLCHKQRNGEWEGKIGLWFERRSFQFLEHPKHKPHRYIDYSLPVSQIKRGEQVKQDEETTDIS